MEISKEQALDCFHSDDLIGIGMEADAVRRAFHPENVVTYAIKRSICDDAFASDDLGTTAGAGSMQWATWLEMHRLAHERGLRTTARLLFGAGESLEQRIEHLFAIRQIQAQTSGFMSFAPSSYKPATPRSEFEEPTAVEYLRTLAISRMILNNIENIESDCVAQGLKVTQMAFRFGANDAGTIVAEEGIRGNRPFTEEDLRRIVRDAGFRPIERDAEYRTLFLDS